MKERDLLAERRAIIERSRAERAKEMEHCPLAVAYGWRESGPIGLGTLGKGNTGRVRPQSCGTLPRATPERSAEATAANNL